EHRPVGAPAHPSAGRTGTAPLRPSGSRAGGARLRPTRRAPWRALSGALVLAGALTLLGALPGSGATPRAAAAPSGAEAFPQTDASVPAHLVTMIGATPEEPGAPGGAETWGVGSEGSTTVLVRYTSSGGWTLGPGLPAGFKLADSQLAGEMSP